jgi:hypothetical protein
MSINIVQNNIFLFYFILWIPIEDFKTKHLAFILTTEILTVYPMPTCIVPVFTHHQAGF